jgi:NitT/TauT family transport system substrate-binding protein
LKLLRMSLIGLTLVLINAACGAAQQSTISVDPVNVQLSWIHTIEYAGLYEAIDEGYYAVEHLDTKLNTGGFDENGNFINPIEKVVNGDAHFGIIDAQTLLLARAEGQPVVAVASIYQRSPVAFVSLSEKNILKPEDLVGATASIELTTSGGLFRSLLNSTGVDPTAVNMVQRTDYTTAPLFDGSADVIDGWITNEAVILSREGHAYNTLLASDYGIEPYANVIFTLEETITAKPDLVERFLRATSQGIQRAVEHPEEAAQLAIGYNAERDLAIETEAMKSSVPLLNPNQSHPGMMSNEIWEVTHQILLDEGVLSEPLDIHAAYTLTFLNRIYAGSA